VKQRARSRALIFTMDSIDQYVGNSKRGGPSGEITIRKSLMEGLTTVLNCECDVATSDNHFEQLAQRIDQYALIILDPWTWAAPGWVPKPPLRGNEARIFLLDFFGAKQVTSPKGPHPNMLKVPPERMLTAFPTSPWNTFLGYAIKPSQMPAAATLSKKRQGVIWGKDAKHYQGREGLLRALADSCDCELHSTLGSPLVRHPNIIYHGHLSKAGWSELLSSSKFMIGLGNPLVGPSAVDAVVAGAVYINPIYSKPMREVYHSQHPYLEERVGKPHVCSARLEDVEAVKACVMVALDADVAPMIPKELTQEAYNSRVEAIFGPYLPSPN